jgi:hypothetical protein
MVDIPVPGHVAIRRRDGKQAVMLHRSMAVIGGDRVEVKAARATVIVPVIGLILGALAGYVIATGGTSLPLWALIGLLLFCLFDFPVSIMSLVSSIAGADVVVDARKGSITWQQGYLGMGIGTKELVPFGRIDHLRITVEGEAADRWHQHSDTLRQFALWLVKDNGKTLKLAQVPVPAGGQADGMDRTLAVGQAVAALTGAEVRLPEGWELVEIDTETGEEVTRPAGSGREGEPLERD